MEKLSKEDLIKALALAAKPVKPRKKAERNAEQQKELTERLAKMREVSLANRAKKAEAKKTMNEEAPAKSKIEIALDLAKGNVDHKEDIFEKKYSNAFDKMTETLGRLETHFSDIKQMKITKAEQRKMEAEEKAKAKPVEIPKPNVIELAIKEASIEAPMQIQRQSQIQEPPKPFKFNDFNRMSFGKKR